MAVGIWRADTLFKRVIKSLAEALVAPLGLELRRREYRNTLRGALEHAVKLGWLHKRSSTSVRRPAPCRCMRLSRLRRTS